jgi:hypothetical protein
MLAALPVAAVPVAAVPAAVPAGAPVARIDNAYARVATPAPTLSVTVDVVPVGEGGAKTAVTPAGAPSSASVTAPV